MGPSVQGMLSTPKTECAPRRVLPREPHNRIQLMKPQKRQQLKELPYPRLSLPLFQIQIHSLSTPEHNSL